MGIQDRKTRVRAPESEGNCAWHWPVKQEMERLLKELAAFNERIAELGKAGHHGHAMDVLKATALDLSSHIDELRCLLVVPKH
jgi:hypothetical protein